MIAELEEISTAAIDAINHRVETLGQPLEEAVVEVEASLRSRGVDVAFHLSTVSQVCGLEGDNVAVYEVRA